MRKILLILFFMSFFISFSHGNTLQTSLSVVKNKPKTMQERSNNTNDIVSFNIKSYGEFSNLDYKKPTHNNLSFNYDSFALIYGEGYSDFESGLNYQKSRYYFTYLHRFISQDQYDIKNRYSYADSDPINKFDPNGHNALDIISWISNSLGFAGGLNAFAGAISILMTGGSSFFASAAISSGLLAFGASATAFAASSNNDKTLNAISNILGSVSFIYGLPFAIETFNDSKLVGKIAVTFGQFSTAVSYSTGIASSFTNDNNSKTLNDISSITGLMAMIGEVAELKKSINDIKGGEIVDEKKSHPTEESNISKEKINDKKDNSRVSEEDKKDANSFSYPENYFYDKKRRNSEPTLHYNETSKNIIKNNCI